MKRLRIGRAKGRWKNWSWEPNEADRRTMSDLLYRGPRPSACDAGPRISRAGRRCSASSRPSRSIGRRRRLYDATWREFRSELGLAGGSTRKPQGWAADLRFRQKASLLRMPGTADFVAGPARRRAAGRHLRRLPRNQRDAGRRAARPRLAGRRDQWRRNRPTANEAARARLPDRALDAVVFTVTESISLHRARCRAATGSAPCVVHDMRHSAIQLAQIEGRCHRDGQRALIYYAYAEDTVEETIAATVDRRAWPRWAAWRATTRRCWTRSRRCWRKPRRSALPSRDPATRPVRA